MTEPRETETTLDEGEATRPIPQQAPDAAAWYPVDSRPAGDEETVVVENAAEPVAEPIEDSEPVVDEPVVDEPFAGEPLAEDQPVEEPALEEPAAAGEPVDEEAPVDEQAEGEPVVAEPAAEETVVAEPAAEETVALAPESETPEPTAVVQQETVSYPLPAPPAPTDSIFRQPSPTSGPDFEPTRVEQVSDEEQKLAAERAARREARAAALAATAPVALAAAEPVVVHKRTNDKFWGSVGLFLLRLVLAAILAVRGLNILTDIPAAQAQFAQTVIPYPSIMAIVTGVAALLIALSLILGLLTRLSGLGIALIGGGALVFVQWGTWSPFIPGRPGFLGDYELLLTAVGILLLCIGAGGWSLDRSVRAGRERNKAERASAGS
ncbi:MAG TPA: DoxX family membrane protein [Propionicimonas sp.]|uniref:DoxX family protein n=1 Tax=Propionicimonas sp. TaxID=1955623 RepID=UPI002F3F11BC